jgi:hypothetical protein
MFWRPDTPTFSYRGSRETLAQYAGVRPDTPVTMTTARSSVASTPTTDADAVELSMNYTCRLLTPFTT